VILVFAAVYVMAVCATLSALDTWRELR